MAAISGGSKSPASIEISCPTFMAAPRIWASCWVILRALTGGQQQVIDFLGRLPCASSQAPATSMVPATPVAICPMRIKRLWRPLGMVDLATGGVVIKAGGAMGNWIRFAHCQGLYFARALARSRYSSQVLLPQMR